MPSNNNVPSCGMYGKGTCLGGMGPSVSFASATTGDVDDVVDGRREVRATLLPPFISSSGTGSDT